MFRDQMLEETPPTLTIAAVDDAILRRPQA